jgi:hypothetical protein
MHWDSKMAQPVKCKAVLECKWRQRAGSGETQFHEFASRKCSSIAPPVSLLSSWVKTPSLDRHQWLTPVILATQKAEIRRIIVQS